jgi:hypothetical protein
MRLKRLEIDGCLGFERFAMEPRSSGITTIGGANGSGKSSVLLAIQMALCGRSSCRWPDRPLNNGRYAGIITAHLYGCMCLMEPIGLKVALEFFRRPDNTIKESYTIFDSQGHESPEPRTTLRRLRDTTDLEIQPPGCRKMRDHSRYIMQGMRGLEPRELGVYICQNASFLDNDNMKELDAWATTKEVQVIAERHHGKFTVSLEPREDPMLGVLQTPDGIHLSGKN